MKDFFLNSTKLARKKTNNMTFKKALHVILGAIFSNHGMLGAIFAYIFREFAQIFRDFVKVL